MIATRSATIYMPMTLSCTLSDHHRITQMVDDGWIFLNEAKTEAILFLSSVVHSHSRLPSIYVCGSSISMSPTVRYICVLPDSRLDMSAQVSNVSRAAYSNLFRIAKIRTSFTTAACKTIVHSLVTSRLGTLSCTAYQTAPCTASRWYSARRPESSYGSDAVTGEV